MTVLEALVLAAAAAGANPGAKPGPEPEPPPMELLEFIGDWGRDEARLIDQYRPSREKTDGEANKNANDTKIGN